MAKARYYKIINSIPFVFHQDNNEIVVLYNVLGFIRVFLNGAKIASKWSWAGNSFLLFNIDADLYSVQLVSDDLDDAACDCVLNRNDFELQRQRLVFHDSDEFAGGVKFSIVTGVLCIVSLLFLSGCLYWPVADVFFETLYSLTAFMVCLKIGFIFAKIDLQVVPMDTVQRTSPGVLIKPVKANVILNEPSRHLTYFNRMFLCCVGFILVIVIGWGINYSGATIQEHQATIVSQQWLSQGRFTSSFRFAKVDLPTGKRVKADCPGARKGQSVIVREKIAVIFRNTIYECE